jgi:hypothetical protein
MAETLFCPEMQSSTQKPGLFLHEASMQFRTAKRADLLNQLLK